MNKPFIIKGGIAADDRGFLRFVNDFNFQNIKRFYQVENHVSGFIRAWHGHKVEEKYFYVNSGVLLVGAVSLETDEVFKFVLSSQSPSILYIPKGFANGFKNLTKNSILTVFSSTTLDESINDDYRFPYNKWNIWDAEYR